MASVKIEDSHKLLLEKLLSESGVECIRSASESLEPSTLSAETEEPSPHEVDEEEVKEELIEETTAPISEEYVEEQPKVFPSPSLRKILPDRIRKFEEQNRIHVLPDEFRTDIDPELIPKIALTAQQKYIDILGDITGCVTYKKSLAEFWFLDTLANLLGRAQEDEMSRSSQAVLIQWFCEWMKEIQHFDAADRERMLIRFKDNMLSAARCIAVQHRLPTPQEAGVSYKAEEPTKGASHTAAHDPESKHLVTFEGAAYECSLRDLTCIIHYIFDLFSTDYQFNIVRAVFTFTPEYNLIDAPYQIQNPKRLFAPLKLKPRKEPKKEKPSKGKKKEIETEEYLALMELRARDEKDQNEREDRDQDAWHRRNHILPLNFATDDEFFNKFWPPPPPETEPVPEPDPKGKGKGRRKK